jgi:hypothetical protein
MEVDEQGWLGGQGNGHDRRAAWTELRGGGGSTDSGADGDSVGELRRWRARSVRKRGELG